MLVLVGLNHESAPVELREKLAFPEAEVPSALDRLLRCQAVLEGLILSTCNRVEVLVHATDAPRAVAELRDFLARERGLPPEQLNGCAYEHLGGQAVRHLFEVASGLDSMIMGEPQILGQVKQAYRVAREAGSTGPILDHLLQQGFATAKRVRTDTEISRHAVSVAFAAVELARKIFGALEGRSALVIGAGKMTELATRHLVANGIADILVSSRTLSRSSAFARKFRGSAVKWEEACSHLDRVDIVVAGTAAPGTVLDRSRIQEAIRSRRSRPLFIIDIAVPRDVEPSVNELNNVYLYDIDDLQGVVENNLEERRNAAVQARQMIETQVKAFDQWHRTLEVTPTIVALRESLLGLGRQEIERFHRKLGEMTPDQSRAVEELTRAVIQKILHRPIRHLKGVADRSDAGEYAALYQQIFGIRVEPPADGVDAETDAAGEREGQQTARSED